MLRYFNPDILLFIAGQRSGYMIGKRICVTLHACPVVLTPAHFTDFHQVFVTYARNHIKGYIHLNTTVTKIGKYLIFPIDVKHYL